MPLYESRKFAENFIPIEPEQLDAIAFGPESTITALADVITSSPGCAFDGWYNIDWNRIIPALTAELERRSIVCEFFPAASLYRSAAEIAELKKPFIDTGDPGFGIVNTDGTISDLMNPDAVAALAAKLGGSDRKIVVYGPGAAIPELASVCGRIIYFDKTRQPILWEMWDGQLVPFGAEVPRSDYSWKEYYYCDYYLLDRQKNFCMSRLDAYVEGIGFESLKFIPASVYFTIIDRLLEQPVKEVPIFQPGPWGAYRYRELFDVPGLECNAWNELAGPELSMLVDVGGPEMINMPAMNLMIHPEKFVGPLIAREYPDLFPLDVWLDDGYFPKPEPAERISMPIHNHPSTDYVRRHFREPLGRYETYYIAEAYEGANTWLGYREDADLEEWEQLARDSDNRKVIPNWRDFIANHTSRVGDLYLIPPGTAHGHGGNQMVLEMDTCPSIAATEYSFFTYDFARPSWDDNTKTMTAPPVKMHLNHSFDNDKFVREEWAKKHLLAKPEVVAWNRDYQLERYTSDPRMPFDIERLHFDEFARHDTEGRFMHIVTLTVGSEVVLIPEAEPERRVSLRKFQSAIIPAGVGAYRVESETGFSMLVVLHWKRG